MKAMMNQGHNLVRPGEEHHGEEHRQRSAGRVDKGIGGVVLVEETDNRMFSVYRHGKELIRA